MDMFGQDNGHNKYDISLHLCMDTHGRAWTHTYTDILKGGCQILCPELAEQQFVTGSLLKLNMKGYLSVSFLRRAIGLIPYHSRKSPI